ncbi:hypothetical protein NQ318_021795 [Aromia moschata]|uniref:Uncharacterized protein n=1 Tax=Aromia moschata TaxID=1265417 RepID=A0AAV8Z738_9CUCU|nr:hypothetical protein NQ318_021795 [Aromia moschata]
MKIFLLYPFLLTFIGCWDLSSFGINENYYVSSIGIHRTRAFLTLPRSVCHNNVSNPTVVEVAWTINHIYSSSNIPTKRQKILDYQQWGECKDLQDAISVDVEPKKPKIWILDKGNELCLPKIVSYNLFYNNIFESCTLTDIPRQNLNTLVIDRAYGKFGHRAYIGNAGDDTILIFFLDELKYWKLKLLHMDYPFISVSADFLSISKIDPVLYITGRNSIELFSIDLENIRNLEEPLISEAQATNLECKVTFLGHKLEISSGLETDYKNGLSYYLVRDYVVVRWLIGSPLEAEYHNIFAQSYEKLPYVSELFTGPQNGLWALVNPLSPKECMEVNNTILENIPRPENRAVKILKYNKFLDDIF